MGPAVIAQVLLGEVPELLEQLVVARQRGDEHPVAHPFGTDVVVSDVDDVAHVVRGVEADPLVDGVAFKKLTERVLDKLVGEVGAVSYFNKKISGCNALHRLIPWMLFSK